MLVKAGVIEMKEKRVAKIGSLRVPGKKPIANSFGRRRARLGCLLL